ncbi:MAG: hypothetical protein KAW12_00930 [Candidatus Aminicenantes bacterium]|nr:hypothetical protein [Candidatus Aminicenantes bacterium]
MSSDMISIILTFTGLTGVFLFFKIEKVTQILLGDGQSVLDRERNGQLLEKKYWKRLRDAISRKNIYGVYEGLLRITIKEIETIKKPKETGYSKRVLKFFEKTKKILCCLKFFLSIIVILSIGIISNILTYDQKSNQWIKGIPKPEVILIILFTLVTALAVLYSI